MPRFATLDDWLRWQESCHPREIDLGLERVAAVAGRLGLLAPAATVITVAGTNGKGSCVQALQAMLLAGGQTVGSYTSPHLHHYNERIVVNGAMIADGELVAAFEAIDTARQGISLTYFEFGTLAALYLFARAQCAYWLLEVGLGGRLDATNIVDPNLAIITSIGLDHCAWLGDTREAIGREKAGICRAHVPLVCADPAPPKSIAEVVSELGCPTYYIDRDFGCRGLDERQEFYWQGPADTGVSTEVQSQLPAPSVAAAIQALALLRPQHMMGWLAGLSGVSLQGRMQCLRRGEQTWVLDVAHNGAAFEFLWRRLAVVFPQRRWTLVIAMMKDKDIDACIDACRPFVDRWVAVPLDGVERAMPATDLANVIGRRTKGAVEVAATLADGLARALQLAGQDAVLVSGSFYTVAQAISSLQANED